MKIIIHKGTNEIGGSCVEVSTDNSTILIDYGTPLRKDSLPVKINKPVDAILISHPHQDHYGEILNFETETPVYCGALSLELMNAAKLFSKGAPLANFFNIFKAWESFEIGDFRITPYLVDHSSPDAYAFLIEADDKKIFYSGDFQATGRKSKLFDKMLSDVNLKEVDVLLMEGTMLEGSNDKFPDEQSVEDKIFKTITEKNQATFMVSSAQNVDSIIAAYNACKKAGKIFVVDIYTAWILKKMRMVNNHVPSMSWHDVKVIKSNGHGYVESINKNLGYFTGFLAEAFHEDNVIDTTRIRKKPSAYFLKVSPWYIKKFMKSINIKDATLIYSQWLGYLKEEYSKASTVKLYESLKNRCDFVYAHTSGDADLEALQLFISALKPTTLIPVHTEYKEDFKEHFDNVVVLEDGELYEVNS